MNAGTVTVNGTQIYYEVRGSGSSVLLISGALGDAAYYTKIADLLSNEFTIATYDRRGNLTLYLKRYDRISAGGWVWQID
jgi:pimeloyl-ACP methyl ester carboxylesterase